MYNSNKKDTNQETPGHHPTRSNKNYDREDRSPPVPVPPLACAASCTTQSRYFRSGTTTISCFLVRIRSSFTSSSPSRSSPSASLSSCGVLVPFASVSYPPSNPVELDPSPACCVIGLDSETPSAEALETKAKMCAASASACEGWYVDWVGGAGEAGDESGGCASGVWSVGDEADGGARGVPDS